MRLDSPITRRQLLRSSVIAAGALALPSPRLRTFAEEEPALVDPGSLTRFVDPLPLPPLWTTQALATNGLTTAPGLHRFHSQLGYTPTWGYGGAAYLGPTIEATAGSPVEFASHNALGPHVLGVDTALHGPNMANDAVAPRVSLHLHGGYTAPESDGYPEDTYVPGETHPYRYENDQASATIWYHDHALGNTRLNVYAGLAGFYWVRDAKDALLPGGEYEVPLVLQDKSLLTADASGMNRLYYPNPWEPEFFGTLGVVNGAVWPYRDVDRGWYRLRIVNGSSSRFYHLALAPHGHFLQVGTDGGFVNRPRNLRSIVLAPGERADLLVDFGRYTPDRGCSS